jgi:hypothetical protein
MELNMDGSLEGLSQPGCDCPSLQAASRCKTSTLQSEPYCYSPSQSTSPREASILLDEKPFDFTTPRNDSGSPSPASASDDYGAEESKQLSIINALVAGSRLTLPEDRGMVEDSLFVAMGQMEVCLSTEADYNDRGERLAPGVPCLQCKHCGVHRHFPFSLSSLRRSSKAIVLHMEQCISCPAAVRNAVVELRLQDTSGIMIESKSFFRRVWTRIQKMHSSSVGDAPLPLPVVDTDMISPSTIDNPRDGQHRIAQTSQYLLPLPRRVSSTSHSSTGDGFPSSFLFRGDVRPMDLVAISSAAQQPEAPRPDSHMTEKQLEDLASALLQRHPQQEPLVCRNLSSRQIGDLAVIVLQRCLRPSQQFQGRPPSPARSSGLHVVEPELDEVVNTTGEELG